MLVLREVTHADQGLYAIKLASGFTYETVRLTVSGTLVPYISEILLFKMILLEIKGLYSKSTVYFYRKKVSLVTDCYILHNCMLLIACCILF